jgi:hypothetical protein
MKLNVKRERISQKLKVKMKKMKNAHRIIPSLTITELLIFLMLLCANVF